MNARLLMFGPAPEARGGIATIVNTYRSAGLFKRWPIDYLATHGEGGLTRNLHLAFAALRGFVAALVQERGSVVVHLHLAAGRGLWRDTLFVALALAARCPLILHLHGAGFERLHERAGNAGRVLMRIVFEQAACVVAPCESLRAWVRGVARNAQVVCIANPVTGDEVGADARRSNLVLFLGRLDASKGLFDLLEALSALRPVVPDVQLVCAGEGERKAVLRYAERLGIADALKFTGWVGPSGKRALLESAAVFALPSYDESLPMSVLEAMAAGLPVIVSPVGGVPEVVVDGVSGFFAAPGDVTTLARLLGKLLLDRNLAARVGAAARQSVRLRSTPERVAARLGELYAALGVQAAGEPARPVCAESPAG